MINSIIRKSVIAFAAASTLFVAAPAVAGGWDEPELLVTEQGVFIDGRNTRRDRYEEVNQRFLSQHQIVRSLRHQGYAEVREIDFRHDTYRVVAIRHNGAVVKLKVSAHNGRVISERRIGWVRSAPVRGYDHPAPRRHHAQPGFSIEFGFSN